MRAIQIGRVAGHTSRTGRSVLLTVAALCGLLVPSFAVASPITYNFTSGSVLLYAVLDDGAATSVLSGPSPVNVLLGGTFVTFDPDGGINGSLIGFQFVPASVLNLDLNEALVGLDTISVANSMLVNDPNHDTFVSPEGVFYTNSIMTGDVSGFMAGGIPFGPVPVTSITSELQGTLAVSGDSIAFDLHGINLARFRQIGAPAGSPDVLVKGNFSFAGTVIPEPGTAILLGLGLAGLARTGRRTTSR